MNSFLSPSQLKWAARTNIDHDVQENLLPSRINIVASTALGIIIPIFVLGVTWAAVEGSEFKLFPERYLSLEALIIPSMFACGYHLRKTVRAAAIWWAQRRSIVVAEYEPPCPPALAGAIINRDFDMKELEATLEDLVGRGYLAITTSQGKQQISRTDRNAGELLAYERLLLDDLLPKGWLSQPYPVDRFGLALFLPVLRDAVQAELASRGALPSRRPPGLLSSIRFIGLIFGYFSGAWVVMFMIGLLTLGIGLLVHPENYPTITAVSIPQAPGFEGNINLYAWAFTVLELMLFTVPLVVGYIQGRRWIQQRGLLQDVAGLYLFIKVVFGRSSRYSSSDRERYHPYAVAFGLQTPRI